MLREKCPCCGRKNVNNKKLFFRDFSLCDTIVPFMKYDVFGCMDCGLYYAGDIQESLSLDNYYQFVSRYEGGGYCNTENLSKLHSHIAQVIKGIVSPDVKIIDIGCAFGGLLSALKTFGFHHLYGLEPSQENCDYANAQGGIKVYRGELGDNIEEISDKKFDVVILCCVLEHLLDIHTSIQQCKRLLKSDGKLVVVVPDVDLFCDHKDLYQEFSIEHINYFGIQGLRSLMSLEGFELEKAEKDIADVMGLSGNLISIWMMSDRQGGRFNEKMFMTKKADMTCMDQYLHMCSELAKEIKQKLASYDISDGCYVWGVGTNTAMLIQLGILPVSLIKGVFDSNLNYNGKIAYGYNILSPDKLLEKESRPILIASQYAFDAIKQNIIKMGLKNPIIDLFSDI